MAIVRAFQIEGLKIWFWSNDHEPPHFHAKRNGEWEVKIYFLLAPSMMVEMEMWNKKTPAKKTLKELTSLAERHRVDLLAQWQEIRDQEGGRE